jgi:hypothetical protein
MLFAFSSLYSDESEQLYDDEIELCDEEIENVEVGQHALKEYHVSDKSKKKKAKLSYFLYTEDFIKSFIEVPTSNVASDSTTVSSRYLAGRAPVYNLKGEKVGICSASFLCMQNQENIFTDISNYLSIDNGLIVTWFTPTTLINLELDSILNSMVTECIVTASTKVGVNPFYGKKYNMIVSSDQSKIYFKLHKL